MGPNAAHETSKEPFATQFLTSVCHFMGAMVPRVGDPTWARPVRSRASRSRLDGPLSAHPGGVIR